MLNLKSDIGTAKDNYNSPVHNWYKFTAGFSYRFVERVIEYEGLNSNDIILDPFAGCGTTLVSAQKKGIPAIGFEAQKFMYEIIKGKLAWNLNDDIIDEHLNAVKSLICNKTNDYDIEENAHDLLSTLYDEKNLRQLYLIKDYLENSNLSESYYNFLKLALSQTLHKVCIHPIAVPYIVRTKTLSNDKITIDVFDRIIQKMKKDIQDLKNLNRSSKIYLHDSRARNRYIPDNTCDVCITSPPYLNNLDYGEVSKVHTHFFGYTKTWKDITKDIRKKLVTASTTHYSNNNFDIESWKTEKFFQENKQVGDTLIKIYQEILKVRKSKKTGGGKSYNIMALYYFQDMYLVLKEIRRILKPNKSAFFILGNSAPYGVLINTTDLLGQIALSAGFKEYDIIEIRKRGSKWQNLTYRHNKELTENVLVLK